MLKQLLIQYFPGLGRVKRYFTALYHCLHIKKSYSQFGEDAYILEFLASKGIHKGIYVDVGANHPSSISNTYLLYCNGYSGIVIEPNKELINLFRIFRKRDIPICVGCSDKAGIAKFFVSKTPVVSTFTTEHQFYSEKNTASIELMPLLTLDDCLKNLDLTRIDFLSIDVEGMNRQVIEGATSTINKTFLLCVEFDDDDLQWFQNHLNDFKLEKVMGCNAIFMNTSFTVEPSSF